jgi:ABC-type multidrug transport system permease subunit
VARPSASVGSVVVLILSFVGGAMFPRFLMAEWLQTVSRGLPTYWATAGGLAAMTWRRLGLGAALLLVGVLLAFGSLFAASGVRSYRWSV